MEVYDRIKNITPDNLTELYNIMYNLKRMDET